MVNTLEIERASFLQGLKKFRPNQTVFELEISKKHKNSHLEGECAHGSRAALIDVN